MRRGKGKKGDEIEEGRNGRQIDEESGTMKRGKEGTSKCRKGIADEERGEDRAWRKAEGG